MYETTVTLVNDEEVDVEIPPADPDDIRLINRHATPGLKGERIPCIADFNHLLVILTHLTSLDQEEAASISVNDLPRFIDEIIDAIQDEEDSGGSTLDGLPLDEYGQVDLEDMR